MRERDESDSSRWSHGWLTRCDAWAHGVCACDVLEADVEEERWRGEGGRDMRAVDRMSMRALAKGALDAPTPGDSEYRYYNSSEEALDETRARTPALPRRLHPLRQLHRNAVEL